MILLLICGYSNEQTKAIEFKIYIFEHNVSDKMLENML